MANRTANTQPFRIRPSVELVEALQRLFPGCGMSTANELAVELLAHAVAMLESKQSPPPMPPEFLLLRAKLHGGEIERPSSLPSPEDFREMMRSLVYEVLAETKGQTDAKTGESDSQHSAEGKRQKPRKK